MTAPEDPHRLLLHKVKEIHSSVKNSINNDIANVEMLHNVKCELAQLHRDINTLRRHAAAREEQHLVAVAIMKEEMREELVQREANSARTAERFRAFCNQKSGGAQSAFDRAAATAASIEACVNALSCESLCCSRGTALLHQQATKND